MEYTISASKKVEKKSAAALNGVSSLCPSNVPGFGFADLDVRSLKGFHHSLLCEEELNVDLVSFFDGDLFDDPG